MLNNSAQQLRPFVTQNKIYFYLQGLRYFDSNIKPFEAYLIKIVKPVFKKTTRKQL
jgi:hypothetical protein